MKTFLSRRNFLRVCGYGALGAGALGSYSGYIEPAMRLNITRYKVHPPQWTADLNLKIAALADIHAGEGFMTEERLAHIVERTNAQKPDMIVLLGDYLTGTYKRPGFMAAADIARILSRLNAPLGVYSVLGNHDWWNDKEAFIRRKGPIQMGKALEKVGIPVLENQALRLSKDGKPFWLAGLGDQWSFFTSRDGVDDLPKTLAAITDSEPVIMLAHEPDIFPRLPSRVNVTLCGHTHGGQLRLFGYSPVVPSRYGNRYSYGHIVENGKHLIVSGGLGSVGASLAALSPKFFKKLGSVAYKKMYVRLGVPPEIVIVHVMQ